MRVLGNPACNTRWDANAQPFTIHVDMYMCWPYEYLSKGYPVIHPWHTHTHTHMQWCVCMRTGAFCACTYTHEKVLSVTWSAKNVYGNKGFYGQKRCAARLGYIYECMQAVQGEEFLPRLVTHSNLYSPANRTRGSGKCGIGWGMSTSFLCAFHCKNLSRLPCNKAFSGLRGQLPDVIFLCILWQW